jgi:glyoxylase-like metal-dependent hydrolase (beta-lactamase superfamily II)
MDTLHSVYTSQQIAPNTWMILGDGCTTYLVVGDEKGIMIDTGFAEGNIREYASTLTDKPVREVLNTHGHFDHTALNGQFDLAYMTKEASLVARIPYEDMKERSFLLDYPIHYVEEGDVIHLGNRDLELFRIPAHAPGSIAILDRKERILFTGDEIMPVAMLHYHQDTPQPSVNQFSKNLHRILAMRDSFDKLYSGHASKALTIDVVEKLLKAAEYILADNETPRFVPPPPRGDGHQLEFPFIEHVHMLEMDGVKIGYDTRYVHSSPYDLSE